jgi:hypothetical protein
LTVWLLIYLVFADWLIGPGQKSGRLSNYTAKPSRRYFRPPAMQASDRREGTRGSGIIRCRKPGILAKIELRIPFQRPIRFLPETDYPRASCSFPRIAGSGNEIAWQVKSSSWTE